MDFLTATGGTLIGTVIPFLVVLTVVVFVHELGHFWVARRAGVAVSVFSIGFGPELLGMTDRKGTRWKLSALPLGVIVMWLVINQSVAPGHIVLGVLIALPVTWFTRRLRPLRAQPRKLWVGFKLLAVVLRERGAGCQQEQEREGQGAISHAARLPESVGSRSRAA